MKTNDEWRYSSTFLTFVLEGCEWPALSMVPRAGG